MMKERRERMEGEQGHPHTSKIWLEDISKGLLRELDAISLGGLHIQHVEKGLIRCKFLIPKHLSDKDGNWHAGAIAVLVDSISIAAAFSANGRVGVSVNFDISYFSAAKIHEEVEIEGKVAGHKDKLAMVMVRIGKKGSGEMVALAKQWVSSTSIGLGITLGSSKL
ncbi:uncharacterized protein LOC131324682 [Rhododendron vialii]|uniref:uncharacterized protein LOC131324682 n=1 Tax=Rhododendron vialii TaxID=182163 RepID=UPI00265FF435|nr:uncharacterized protein LOC131324682 [Rhododendron vialii]